MQNGTVGRHRDGWRGRWREDGKTRTTRTARTKGEARRLLNTELARLEQGDAYVAPITLRELAERFHDQYAAAPQTRAYARRRMVRPLAAFGDAQASDLTTEALQRFLVSQEVSKAYRRDIMRTLRMVYAFGHDAGLVAKNPTSKLKAPAPKRGTHILPFESWAEVEAVAHQAGRWGPLILFMADSGARPAEAVALQRRHVNGQAVELPGAKTENAPRVVDLTRRGLAAIKAVPVALDTRHVFHIDGRPVSWPYFYREVWPTALDGAGLAYRSPYNLRHTFAFFSLRAGVPIADVAEDMGHADVSQTYRVYGGWHHERGQRAALLRESWADATHARPDHGESL